MEDFELFGTKDEARAFIDGLEKAVEATDGEVYTEIGRAVTGDWKVTYRIHN